MVTRKTIIYLCLLFTSSIVYAQSVSIDKAIDVGTHFFVQETENSVTPLRVSAINKAQRVTAKVLRYAERECMYAVSMPDSGWVLVSADERVAPILAVSYNGAFPAEEDMPPAMRDLFEDYANEIIYIQDSIDGEPHPEWAALENNTYGAQTFEAGTGSELYIPGDALLNRPDRGEVKWGQSGCNGNGGCVSCTKVYNKFCPDWYTPSCGRTVVGCTAVAMAQIMWYWQWPHTAFVPANVDSDGEPQGSKELHLYDWSLMPNRITASTPMEEVDMIAGFLRDCGHACKMEYKENSSSAAIEDAKKAMINYFYYDGQITYHNKLRDTIEWTVLLRNEINAGRPILYAGYRDGGKGHSFVVDGYNKNNPYLFHVNWGWGDTESTLCWLGSLCANTERCYKHNQEALFGIKPAPNCAPYSTNGTKTLRYGTAGELSINTTVESGEFGVYYSGTEVRLQPGFHAKQGSTLHVAIQHFPCDGIAPQSLRAPKYHQQEEEEYTSEDVLPSAITISPNPTTGLLNIQTDKAIQSVAVYQLDGQKVTEQTGNTVELYDVSAGIYILYICFTDGSVYIDKVIKAN